MVRSIDTLRDSPTGVLDGHLPAPLEPKLAEAQLSTFLAGTRGRKVLVLDDDPTGTQPVHDVPVIARWRAEDFAWAFRQQSRLVFVLTNSRSLPQSAAARVTAEAASTAMEMAAQLGVEISLVSRSDSTLRGHFATEVTALLNISAERARPADGVLFCPAYLEAGRVTVGGEHLILEPTGAHTRVSDSDYAKDATFGFSSSRLAKYVEEKTAGRIPTDDVITLDLHCIRQGGVAQVADRLREAKGGRIVAVDCVDYSDLAVVSAAVLSLEREGRRFIFRTGPSFVRAYGGITPRAALRHDDLVRGEREARYGLVVVGSHVGLSSRQLTALVRARPRPLFQIDVPTLLGDNAETHLRQLAGQVTQALQHENVVLSTSREVVVAGAGDESLAISRRVSGSVAAVVAEIARRAPLGYLLAKGGITASEVFTLGLGASGATVVGSVLPGMVSVWRAADGLDPGLPYVVFAGNVGDDNSLIQVVDVLEGRR